MFQNNPIASVDTAIGRLDFCGASDVKLQKSTIDCFGFPLVAPYQSKGKRYLFKFNLIPGINTAELDQMAVLRDVMIAFDELIQMYEVVRRFGRISYNGSTTPHYVKRQMCLLIFGKELKVEKVLAAA